MNVSGALVKARAHCSHSWRVRATSKNILFVFVRPIDKLFAGGEARQGSINFREVLSQNLQKGCDRNCRREPRQLARRHQRGAYRERQRTSR